MMNAAASVGRPRGGSVRHQELGKCRAPPCLRRGPEPGRHHYWTIKRSLVL